MTAGGTDARAGRGQGAGARTAKRTRTTTSATRTTKTTRTTRTTRMTTTRMTRMTRTERRSRGLLRTGWAQAVVGHGLPDGMGEGGIVWRAGLHGDGEPGGSCPRAGGITDGDHGCGGIHSGGGREPGEHRRSEERRVGEEAR